MEAMPKKLVFLFIMVNGAVMHDLGESVHGNLDDSWKPFMRRKCGTNSPSDEFPYLREPRSIGGRKTLNDEYPWVVAIRTGDGGYCSGALISPRHILTAAHCVVEFNDGICSLLQILHLTEKQKKSFLSYKPLPTDKMEVYSGLDRYPPLYLDRYLVLFVVNMTIHPNYQPCDLEYDIAVLELTPLSLRRGVPICMPVRNETIPETVTFAGFGENPDHPGIQPLEAVNLTVNWTVTNSSLPYKQIVTDTQKSRTICDGDSGGPLFKWNGTRYILLGIGSASYSCEDYTVEEVRTGFFEDVGLHVDWVCHHSGKLVFATEMMRVEVTFLFVLIDVASLQDYGETVHGNLDYQWRKWLDKTCGKRIQLNHLPFRPIRSIGGKKVPKGEYPWTVAIKANGAFCSGALISPRHVLTAGHCVAKAFDDRLCLLKKVLTEEEKKKWFKCTPLPTDDIQVYIGAYHNPPLPSERFLYVAPIMANFTIHPKCDQCSFDHDLAVLEVSPNALRHGPPICMPMENETIPDNVTFAGYGLNPEHPNDHPLEAVNLTVEWNSTNASPEKELIVTRSDGRTICSGDSGGPLFKWNGRRYILLGIASSGSSCQQAAEDEAGTSFFEDIRKHTEWVCQNSGVCTI